MGKVTKKETSQNNDCFIIMPIGDSDGYEKGHFRRVYEDIFKAACIKAQFHPIRADEVKQTNLIHLDILQKLIDSPMAICDLSNRNPNVLFELGLRQAFDKPTVLVQEIGTPKIFDISPLRYTEYRRELKYREVLEDQDFISDALKATKAATDNGEGVNSIVSLLSLASPAALKDVTDNDATKMLQIVMSEMNDLRTDFRRAIRHIDSPNQDEFRTRESEAAYMSLRNRFYRFKELISSDPPFDQVKVFYDDLQKRFSVVAGYRMPHNKMEQLREISNEIDMLFAKQVKDKPDN